MKNPSRVQEIALDATLRVAALRRAAEQKAYKPVSLYTPYLASIPESPLPGSLRVVTQDYPQLPLPLASVSPGKSMDSKPTDPQHPASVPIGVMPGEPATDPTGFMPEEPAAPQKRFYQTFDSVPKIKITKSDLQEKVRLSGGNRLVLFLVDASESMDVSNQLAAAKGAVLLLLSGAYVRRDKVGLIAFQGEKAQVIVPPTPSIALAKPRLKELRPYGATPLADGLFTAWKIIQKERFKHPHQRVVLIILSDGEGNVPLVPGADRNQELLQLSRLIAKEKIHVVFVDTTPEGKETDAPHKLAETLQGEYKRLLQLGSLDLVDLVAKEKGWQRNQSI